MIAAIQRYFTSVPPMFIDGALYALIAWFTFNQAYFGGDEAAKYIEPETKFWLNWAIGSSASLFAAIKMFRSTSYSEHLEEVKKEEKSGT
jgi:hypothetical protein